MLKKVSIITCLSVQYKILEPLATPLRRELADLWLELSSKQVHR